VRPKESFRSLSPSIEHPNNFGGFLYFRDNGTAVAYLISPSLNIIPSGGIEALIDVYQTSSIVIHDKEKLRFVDEREFLRFTDVEDFDETLNLIKAKTISDQAKDGLILSRTLVHRACRSGCGKEDIGFLLRSEHGEVDNLSYQDEELQWTPLHYACRFNPQDEELIDFLVDLCRPALLKKDRYHRYPLHIACDSHASESVISILLNEDHDDKALLSSTLKLKRLPLHIALNRGVSFEVIELLLEKSYLGMYNSIRKDTKIGRLPLHIAIEKRLPSNIIKALLEADASINQSDQNTDSDDIYQRFNGRLPRKFVKLVYTRCTSSA
jgi:ankyrin repeat protein